MIEKWYFVEATFVEWLFYCILWNSDWPLLSCVWCV